MSLCFADCHAASVAGRKPARECQVHSVRQDMWQCATPAGLALPLVQGHGEWAGCMGLAPAPCAFSAGPEVPISEVAGSVPGDAGDPL